MGDEGAGGERITNAQYFSTRGYANDFAVPERSRRAVQVPNAQCPIPNAQSIKK